jgi:putative endonuclease
MFFLGKKPKPSGSAPTTAQRRGQAAEDQALAYLQAQGLRLLARNYQVPGRAGGEIDLILQESDGTAVLVEVRSRSSGDFGGAGASIGAAKQRKLVQAAQHWLLTSGHTGACRFDAVLIDGSSNGAALQWVRGAFDAA